MSRLDRFGTILIILLLAVTIGGGLVVWSNCRSSPPIEISLPADEAITGDILINGAVTNPGYYPFTEGDSIEDLVSAAGGFNGDSEQFQLELYITGGDSDSESQKIDINRAEAWLLDALPGIGPAKAQAIVEYRQQNGPFRSTDEITEVDGIGEAIYEQIKNMITVSEE